MVGGSARARRVFVTGGTGFVGRHIVEQSRAAGWAVTVLHRPSSKTRALAAVGADLAVGVLHDEASVFAAIPEGTDSVIHVAGNTSVWRQNRAALERDNIDGTRAVVAAAIRRGVRRIVLTSTASVFGKQPGTISERSPRAGLSSWVDYDRTKALGEAAFFEMTAGAVEAVALYPSHVMGPYDTGNWARIIRMVHEGTLPGVPPGHGHFCDVREVARAHLTALELPSPKPGYLLSGTEASFLELVQVIGRQLSKKVPRRATPAFVLKGLSQWNQLRSRFTGQEPSLTPEGASKVCAALDLDDSLATAELGYRKTPLDALVADTVAWMRSSGAL